MLERDNGQGPAAEWKSAFLIRTSRAAATTIEKKQILDLLDVRDRT